MKRLLILFSLIFSLALGSQAQITDQQRLAVVRILSVGEGGGTGTGFVISSDGLIMTNNHVIASKDTAADHPFTYIVLQKVGDRVIAYRADFVAQEPSSDLAVLRCPGIKAAPFQFLLPPPKILQDVYSMGFPGVADATQVVSGERVGTFNADLMEATNDLLNQQKATPLDITDLFQEAYKKHMKESAQDAAAQLQAVSAELQKITATLSNPDVLKKSAQEQNKKPEDLKKELEEKQQKLEALKPKLEALKKSLEDFCASAQTAQLTKFLQDFATSTCPPGKVEKLTEGSVNFGPTTIPLIEHSCNIRHGNSGGPLLNAGGQVLGVVGDSYVGQDNNEVRLAVQTVQVQKFLQANGINNCNFTDKERIPTPNYLAITIAASLAVAVALAALLVTLFRTRRKTGMTALVESLRKKGISSGTQLLEMLGARPKPDASPASSPVLPTPKGGWKLDGRTSAGKTFQIPISESMFATNSSRLVLGRSRDLCDLVVEDETVSRQHAEIRKNGTGFVVADRNSSNGTAVNGVFNRKPFEPVPFKPGDTLTIGNVKLDFR